MKGWDEVARLRQCPRCNLELLKVRSPQDHRRFFAVIGKAYDQWPEAHEFVPTSSEHLRAWLLCKAGYDTVQLVEPAEDLMGLMSERERNNIIKLMALAIESGIRAAVADGDFAFCRIQGGGVAVFRPRSMNFETLDQKAFGPVREAVEEIIEAEIGVPVDKILNTEAA